MDPGAYRLNPAQAFSLNQRIPLLRLGVVRPSLRLVPCMIHIALTVSTAVVAPRPEFQKLGYHPVVGPQKLKPGSRLEVGEAISFLRSLPGGFPTMRLCVGRGCHFMALALLRHQGRSRKTSTPVTIQQIGITRWMTLSP